MAVGKTLLKSTLFSLRDPALALAHVNAELSEDNDACMFITLFCGMIHLKTGDMIYSCAGHNPPLLMRGSGSVEWVTPAPCPPVGICPGIAYHNHSVRLAPGDLLLLYTDGVTEAMDPSDVLFGDERLLDFARRHREDSASDLVGALRQVVHAHAAGAEQSDDITALAVRYLGPSDGAESTPTGTIPSAERSPDASLSLHNRIDELPRLREWLDALAGPLSLSAEIVGQLHLALEEWVANVVAHAFPDGGEHTIQLRLWRMPSEVRIAIEDDGEPFDPTARAEPDTTLPLEHRPIGGLGIHFVRKTMDGFSYRREGKSNIVTLVKRIDEG
jgi:sigma-B regulation protein RsbU (phosphoserine phosphatase)